MVEVLNSVEVVDDGSCERFLPPVLMLQHFFLVPRASMIRCHALACTAVVRLLATMAGSESCDLLLVAAGRLLHLGSKPREDSLSL